MQRMKEITSLLLALLATCDILIQVNLCQKLTNKMKTKTPESSTFDAYSKINDLLVRNEESESVEGNMRLAIEWYERLKSKAKSDLTEEELEILDPLKHFTQLTLVQHDKNCHESSYGILFYNDEATRGHIFRDPIRHCRIENIIYHIAEAHALKCQDIHLMKFKEPTPRRYFPKRPEFPEVFLDKMIDYMNSTNRLDPFKRHFSLKSQKLGRIVYEALEKLETSDTIGEIKTPTKSSWGRGRVNIHAIKVVVHAFEDQAKYFLKTIGSRIKFTDFDAKIVGPNKKLSWQDTQSYYHRYAQYKISQAVIIESDYITNALADVIKTML